ncbi:hypothetical protein [Aequorivita vladivostokensis]|jgi:hypothetical protein|uniref:Sugar transporter n=1 Tax=Aequorivita vladivostokensis TaxID=171194 RepID=A0ABR5DH58_9FLAO|nr:hypothetical protein [Aequorivita vladivostokensis]KJJ38115.1 hypothetical protein MB09_10835 [Aequorivita vladivostokensis]MAB57624.1 hypothetical protein [Aequorivita sp.]MAO49172.1 hypothetical protein [Aequorivita sp.]MBF30338.1 hypothetical protein [Aequorivita sp.]|tara:strand:- start:189233 stop:189667 length:435 start_codon:yes stop_codon:yes gene_type:complete
MNTTTKPNTAFWIIAVFALLWNLIGVYLWLYEYFLITDEVRATLPQEQVEIMASAPIWSMYVYGLAVITGLLASVFLLMRKKLAVAVFLLSLIAVLILQLYWIFAMGTIEKLGPQSLFMPLIVIALAIFEYFYSMGAARNGWLT